MRIAFLIVVALHGMIHLLGFVKAFELGEIKELSLPISKSAGLLWLTAAVLFIVYAILHLTHHTYAWLFGFIAVILSQVLIILFWGDAKFGTLPNILILAVSILSFGSYSFQKIIDKETSQIIRQNQSAAEKTVTAEDVKHLPGAVQHWLSTSGMIGKPYIRIGKVTQKAQMKLRPDQENWMSATATQYSTIHKPAFIWTTHVIMNPLLFFQGRDKFTEGRGEMLIKLNSLFNIVDARGEKINEGSLQRYLGEMVWFPSLALHPDISWQPVDDHTAKATLEYKGTKGSGTFYFNSEGDFIKFSAWRFMGNEEDSKRQEWVLLVDEYRQFEGIKVPAKMTATWKLEEGDWTWLKLEITDIKYNENAGS